ncbi:phage head spike fiber domain-containing protein [Roseospira goensis]|uniref:Uncharacterized protein n=1 Tax=Roseospira goensis TaxID=391922 RepID=A0A7W6RXM8_9PROT|nr:hypothetical protein [Roseospira goensis]MBB4285123.1 hypothetical protein [Roseospira goensis]
MSLIYPTITLLARPDVQPSALTVARPSAATRIDPLGRVVAVAADSLRHDYDPDTGHYRGWLIEEARTNRIVSSESMAPSPWQTTGASLTSDTVTGPDGLTGADTLTEDSASTVHTLYQDGLAYAAGQPHTLSVFAKSHGRERLQLVLPSTAFGTVHSAVFDLTTGTVGFTEGTVTTSLRALPDGWVRCALTATAVAGGTSNAHFRLRDSGGVSDYPGDGVSGVHLWGAQMEGGGFPTSYIPTADAPVTRAADAIHLTLAGRPFNPREGALLVSGAAEAGTTATLCEIGDGGPGHRFAVTLDPDAGTAAFTVVTGGATVASLSHGGVTAGTLVRAAAAYAVDDFAFGVGGGTVATDGAGALPASPTTLTVGGTGAGVVGPRCWVRQIGVFPRRLADDDLQTLTL